MRLFSKSKDRVASLATPARKTNAASQLNYGDLLEEQHGLGYARVAVKLGTGGFIAFLLWAGFTPVHEVTVGQGEILPQGFVHTVQHLDGGIVADVLVAEGESIESGAPILAISNGSIQSELAQARARGEALRLAIERSQAFIDEREANIESKEDIARIVESQRAVSVFETNFRETQLAVIDSDVSVAEVELKAIELRREKALEELEIISRRLKDYNAAARDGAISMRERDEVERDKLRLEIEIARMGGEKNAAFASITNALARRAEMKARFRQEALDEVAEFETELAETNELISQLESRLDRSYVRAPSSGLVHNLAVRNEGSVIEPGGVVAEIIPQEGGVFAEVDVNADQIGFIDVGMEAKVKILTYDFARFGGLEGTVTHISPSSFAREDGTNYFKVRLLLSASHVGDQAEGRDVKPGLSIVADIKSGNKSVLAYLLKPLRALSDRAFTET